MYGVPFCCLLVGSHRDGSCARAPLHVGDPERGVVRLEAGQLLVPKALAASGFGAHVWTHHTSGPQVPPWATDRPAVALWPEFLAELTLQPLRRLA